MRSREKKPGVRPPPKRPQVGKTWRRLRLPQYIRSLADCDYLHSLKPAELEIMNTFLDAYYAHNWRPGPYGGEDWSPEQRAYSYALDNQGREGAFRGEIFGLLTYAGDEDLEMGAISAEQALAPVDDYDYQQTPEYREALAALRAGIDRDKRIRTPKRARELRALQRKVLVHTPIATEPKRGKNKS